MKFTIITVCYNAEKLIERTIRSVIEQTYSDIEYIVIDGKSKDSTMNIVNSYADKISLIISESDEGIYDAMNKGIKAATGDYINFMNAGDIFSTDDVLEKVAAQIDPDTDLIYGNSIVLLPNGTTYRAKRDPLEVLNKRPVFRHNAAFIRSSLHKMIPFDLSKISEFEYALDYNNIFTLYKRGAKFKKINTDIVTWLKEGTSNNPLKNIILCFRISHQFNPPTIKQRLTYYIDILKGCRRELLKKINPSYLYHSDKSSGID